MSKIALALIGLLAVPLLFAPPQGQLAASAIAAVSPDAAPNVAENTEQLQLPVNKLPVKDEQLQRLTEQTATDKSAIAELRRQIEDLQMKYEGLAQENRDLRAERLQASQQQTPVQAAQQQPVSRPTFSPVYYANQSACSAANGGGSCGPRAMRRRAGRNY